MRNRRFSGTGVFASVLSEKTLSPQPVCSMPGLTARIFDWRVLQPAQGGSVESPVIVDDAEVIRDLDAACPAAAALCTGNRARRPGCAADLGKTERAATIRSNADHVIDEVARARQALELQVATLRDKVEGLEMLLGEGGEV